MRQERDRSVPYFNADELPSPSNHYVAWLDVMGVESIMSRSLPVSANFIFKFHSIALDVQPSGLDIYPVMDGIYAIAAGQDPVKRFLRALFERLADVFVGEKEDKHKFLVRGGLAYGPIVRGADVTKDAAPSVASNPSYAGTLLLGMPIIQAHQGEGKAPPFGVFVSESARAFAPSLTSPFNEVWWRWFEPTNHGLAVALRGSLEAYYAWCDQHSLPILYDSPRIEAHRTMARQFLPEK